MFGFYVLETGDVRRRRVTRSITFLRAQARGRAGGPGAWNLKWAESTAKKRCVRRSPTSAAATTL